MTELTVPLKNQAYEISIALVNKTDATLFKSSPTIAVGDAKISKDGGVLVNLTNTPTSSGKLVNINLTSDEMNADSVLILFSDVAGNEWCDNMIELKPSSGSIGEIFTLITRLGITIWNYVRRTLTVLS